MREAETWAGTPVLKYEAQALDKALALLQCLLDIIHKRRRRALTGGGRERCSAISCCCHGQTWHFSRTVVNNWWCVQSLGIQNGIKRIVCFGQSKTWPWPSLSLAMTSVNLRTLSSGQHVFHSTQNQWYIGGSIQSLTSKGNCAGNALVSACTASNRTASRSSKTRRRATRSGREPCASSSYLCSTTWRCRSRRPFGLYACSVGRRKQARACLRRQHSNMSCISQPFPLGRARLPSNAAVASAKDTIENQC